jgi:hypothetical protein
MQDLAYVLQIALGLVFTASALPKLRDPSAFARTVTQHRLLGPRASTVAAYGVIAVETFLAIALLTGLAVTVALVVAAATVLAFGVATAINLARGLDVSCGCFGESEERISPRSLVRLGLILAAIAALGALLASGEAAATTLADVADQGADYAVASAALAAALIIVALWALHARELTGLLRHPSRGV